MRVLNLAPGYEPVLETLLGVVRRQKNYSKYTRPSTSTVIGLGTSHHKSEQKQAGDILGRDWEKDGEAGWVEKEILAG